MEILSTPHISNGEQALFEQMPQAFPGGSTSNIPGTCSLCHKNKQEGCTCNGAPFSEFLNS